MNNLKWWVCWLLPLTAHAYQNDLRLAFAPAFGKLSLIICCQVGNDMKANSFWLGLGSEHAWSLVLEFQVFPMAQAFAL